MLPSIILALALSLPFSVAAVPPRRDETLHIPLIRRRSNVRRRDVDYAAVAGGLKHKYGYGSSSPSRRAQTTDIAITNQVRLFYDPFCCPSHNMPHNKGSDTSYFAEVSVGTP